MKDELLFKIANDVVKLKAKEGFNSRYIIEEAFNFIYDYNVNKVDLLIKGQVLSLNRDQDASEIYTQFRRMLNTMVEEASKNLPNFDEEITHPFVVANSLCLEVSDNVTLMFSVESALNFVRDFNINNAKMKYESKIVEINPGSSIYEITDTLKRKKDADLSK